MAPTTERAKRRQQFVGGGSSERNAEADGVWLARDRLDGAAFFTSGIASSAKKGWWDMGVKT